MVRKEGRREGGKGGKEERREAGKDRMEGRRGGGREGTRGGRTIPLSGIYSVFKVREGWINYPCVVVSSPSKKKLNFFDVNKDGKVLNK